MTVDGCSGNSKFSVKYMAGAADVTAAVAGGTYQTGTIAPEGKASIELKAKPKKRSGTLNCVVSAVSGGESDAVQASLKAK